MIEDTSWDATDLPIRFRIQLSFSQRLWYSAARLNHLLQRYVSKWVPSSLLFLGKEGADRDSWNVFLKVQASSSLAYMVLHCSLLKLLAWDWIGSTYRQRRAMNDKEDWKVQVFLKAASVSREWSLMLNHFHIKAWLLWAYILVRYSDEKYLNFSLSGYQLWIFR